MDPRTVAARLRTVLIRALLLGIAALGTAAPSGAAAGVATIGPDPLSLESVDGPDGVGLLLSVGLNERAERTLRAELAAGDESARTPLLDLLIRRGRADEAGALLDAWGGAPALDPECAAFTAGRVREGQQRWEDAAGLYRASATREPLLADHASYRAGLALESLGRTDEALDAYQIAAAAARTRELAATASWRAAGLAAAAGNPERALENLERIPPRSVIARQDLLELEARLWRELGNGPREARVLRELFDRAPTSERAVEAIRRLEELETPGIADRISFAETALGNRHATLAERQAREALELLAASGTSDPVAEGKARGLLGKALILRRRLTEARAELANMPSGADPADRAEAELDRARCLWKLGQLDAALAEYDRIVEGSAPDSARADAAWEAARETKDARRWREAALRLGEFAREWPDHEYADDARWHEGRAWAELGETGKALAAFEALRAGHPGSSFLAEASYWIADTRRAAGDAAGACAELAGLLRDEPDSYWAARARERLDEFACPDLPVAPPERADDSDAWLAARFPDIDPAESRRAAEALGGSEPFRRASVLAAVGLLAEAETEMSGLRRSLGSDPAALVAYAEGAWRIGVPRAGMRAMTVLRARDGLPILSGETPARVARLLYPIEHLDAVLRWSSEHELDPLFVFAVMREESWFDARAVSWVGARGLLQIMPTTGRDLARRAGVGNFRSDDLFDPDVNIRLGTYYLRELLDGLDREPALALSAYNAGKRNALRWREAIDGEFDVDRYVAGITYRETYRYVQKVTRTWAIYRHLYGDLVPRLRELREAETGPR